MHKLYFLLVFLLAGPLLSAQDLYDIYQVKEIRINFKQEAWDVILDSLKQVNNGDRLLATIKVDGMTYDSVGVRYKGNSSYFNVRNQESSKLPFNIKANYRKKKQRFKGGYKTLKLSNVFRDPSFLREVLSYEIARKYMPAPKANFTRLYVNDQLLGLYNNTESIDKKFLKEHYGYKEGVLFKCDPSWDAKKKKDCPAGDKASLMYLGEDSLCYQGLYELKTDTGWNALVNLTKVLNKTPEKLESVLNVDQSLWMLAFNNVLVNLDSYTGRLCHNYYLYQDSFGIFQPILWDMNLSFGGFRFDGNGTALSNEKMQRLSPFTHYKTKNKKRPLITQLLRDNLYRKVYVAHIRTILKDFFAESQYEKRGKSIQSSLDFYVKQDENKLYPYESFKLNLSEEALAGKSKIIGIRQLMSERTKYLQAHPLLAKTPPAISQNSHRHREEKTYINVQVKDATEVYLVYRGKPNAPFQRIEMKDDGTQEDRAAGDGYYGIAIDKKIGSQYYIIAVDEKTASLSPERAAREFHEIKY
ncbi:MAG: CotH kinase family protein [Saprospiraceae bacterium]